MVIAIDKVAWIHVVDGLILSTLSAGKSVYYLPGGKREPGESDVQTLVREVREELSVDIVVASAVHLKTFQAQAHGRPDGEIVQMTCYTAGYEGDLKPDNEIAELVWFGYADRHRVSPVDQLIFDHLHERGVLH
ncbi:NUDIX domain-containing protein [Kineosporia rhizophila]|nr:MULTISPECIES: NUDIX domain-containing protein [Kineosporia]MCE0539537.1 NUDIX domain-containing protein [Kineosporia rhizophila]GLY16472.1 DNA mismatch repair protein MutT [Kineosporia sp. NBRC 101677]